MGVPEVAWGGSRCARWAGAAALAIVTVALLAIPARAPAFVFPEAEQGRIAFQLNAGPQDDIWVANGDGSDAINLTNTPTMDEFDPAFSPDGRLIFFSRYDGAQQDIWVMNSDGSDPRKLTNTPAPVEEGRLAPSPDGHSLAFTVSGDGDADVHETEIDPLTGAFTGVRRVLAASPTLQEFDPVYAPDGESILHSGLAAGMTRTLEIDLATGAVLNADLTATPSGAADVYPTLSPDGGRLVFVRLTPGAFNLYTANRDGSGVAPLINLESGITNAQPRFLADGSRIVFARRPGVGADLSLFTVKPDGTEFASLLAQPGAEIQRPAPEAIQRCGKRRATIVGDDGPDKIKGTKKRDVIVANGGKDKVRGRGGKDVICGGDGKDRLGGGKGKDRLLGGKGKDKLIGGKGKDKCVGGRGKDRGKSCEKGKV